MFKLVNLILLIFTISCQSQSTKLISLEGRLSPPSNIPSDLKYWVTVPVKELHDSLFRKMFKLLIEKGIFFNEKSNREKFSPYDYKEPEEIYKIFDFSLSQNRTDNNEDLIVDIFEKILKFSPRTNHPFNLHMKSHGLDPYGISADWLITMLSTPLVTYIFAPAFTLIELKLLKEFRKLVGYLNGVGDGVETIYPNGFALQAAIQHKFPRFKEEGYDGIGRPKVVIFISEYADYTYEKEANVQGIGSEQVIRVPVDPSDGQINVTALENLIRIAILNKQFPTMLVGLAGSRMGTIDNLNELSFLAEKYKMWFHCDGIRGGALLFSNDKAKLLKGIHRADSVSFSPEYLFGSPPDTNLFVTKHVDLCSKVFGIHKPIYVYKTSLLATEKWSLGDQTIQTSRKCNTFKFWYTWHCRGSINMGKHVDHICSNTAFAKNEIKRRSQSFKLLHDYTVMPVVHFYYVPVDLRDFIYLDKTSTKYLKSLGNFTKNLKEDSQLNLDLDLTTPAKLLKLGKLNNNNFTDNLRQDSKMDMNTTSDKYIATLNNFTDNLRNKLITAGILHLSVTKSSNNLTPNFFSLNLAKSMLVEEDIVNIFDNIEKCGWVLENDHDGICQRKPYPPEQSEYPNYISTPSYSVHKEYMEKAIELMLDKGIYFQDKRTERPLKYVEPEELGNIIHDDIKDEGLLDNDLESLEILEKMISYSSHLAHPYFQYQLLSGLDPYSLMADILLSTIPSPTCEYEENPILTLMERELEKAVLNRIGWSDSGEVLFAPGGSIANILSMQMARYNKYPNLGRKGVSDHDKIFKLYFSRDAHYSFPKGAFYLGFGRFHGTIIDIDGQGKMNMTILRNAIEEDIKKGHEPLYIGATFGTTILGALDPLEEITEISEKYGLWTHVDGSFGGSLIMSDNSKIRRLMNGVERADSFSFNPSKLLGSSMLNTIFSIKNGSGELSKKALGSKMLVEFKNFQNQNSLYDTGKWNIDDKYLEYSRRNTAFKLWLMWKAKGSNGISSHLDYCFKLIKFCMEEMKNRPSFIPLLEKFELTNLVFMYVPKRLLDLDRKSKEFFDAMEEVSYELQANLLFGGILIVVTQRHTEEIPFQLKLLFMNSGLTKADIIYHLNEIERIGSKL